MSAWLNPREDWFRSPRRVLTIEVEPGHVKAYAHGLNDDGTRSQYSYGLQGAVRAQVLDGISELVADFIWGRAPR